jgi:predicted  nucleic acid-binding Zn-ribbon protein
LAKRQGALSAVEDAIKVKSKADSYALTKQAEIDGILDAAKVTKATAEALVAELKNNGAELEARIAVNDAELAQREKDVATREKKVQANANELDVRFGELKAENERLKKELAERGERVTVV